MHPSAKRCWPEQNDDDPGWYNEQKTCEGRIEEETITVEALRFETKEVRDVKKEKPAKQRQQQQVIRHSFADY
jgi:hypothetical protein